MANTYLSFDSFAHSNEAGCACPGCCIESANGTGRDGQNDGESGFDGNITAALRLIDLGLMDTIGDARWAGESSESPERDEQQATASSFPYDTDLNDADQGIDGLISGSVWDQTALTYSFPTSASDYESDYYNSGALSTLSGFNATQMDVSRDIFDQYASFSGLTFTELGDDVGENAIDADLRLARSDDPGTAYAYYPNDNPVGGDAMFNTGGYNSPQIGNYQYHTFLHEIGHALGLKHGHTTSGAGAVPYEMDSMEYTVMTYRSWVGKPLNYGYANETWGFSQSLMMLDIAAIQRMYGANFTTNAGDTTYTFSTLTGEMFVDGIGVGTPGGNRIFRTIWDGDGVDTYDFSNYTTDIAVNLAPGEYVDLDTGGNFQRAMLDFGYANNPVTYARGHIFNAMQYEGDARSLIENANGGAGNDSFIGNAADNVFHGNGGNDTFYASAGSDSYFGEAGIDSVVYDALFASYSFSISGTFLQIVDTAIDWVADTIESIVFSDQTWSFGDLFNLDSGNTAPVAVDDAYTVAEDVVLTGGNLLTNDSDPEFDPLSVSAVNGQAANVGSQITLASGALLTVNADGTFTYDQNGAFDYLDVGQTGNDSFSYTIADGQGGSDTATVSITINGYSPPTMSEPVLIDFEADALGAYAGTADFAFSGLDVQAGSILNGSRLGATDAGGDFTITALGADFDFDSAIFRSASGRVRVTIEAWDDGVLVGTDTFNARSNRDSQRRFDSTFDSVDEIRVISNGAILVDDLNFVAYIELDPNAPMAVDDAASTLESAIVSDNALINDTDPNDDPLGVTSFAGGVAAGGTAILASGATVTMLADGGFDYDPNEAFDFLYDGESAVDSFDYEISDGNGGTSTATVNVTVNGEGTPLPAVVIGFEGTIDQDGFVFTDTELTSRAKGVASGSQAGASIGDSLSFSHLDLDSFDFESGYFTALDAKRTTVTVDGYLDDVLIGSESFTISANRETFRALDDSIFDNVDKVVISTGGGVIVDELTLLG